MYRRQAAGADSSYGRMGAAIERLMIPGSNAKPEQLSTAEPFAGMH